jgi:integrase
VKNRRTPYDALVSLSRQNAEVDVRHPRRALGADLFAQLVEAARVGKAFRGLTGPDRAILYTTAAYTGLRASELASLTPESFELDAALPTLTVEAAYSKRRRQDTIVLRPDLAKLLGEYITPKEPGCPLWPGTWVDIGAEMVRLDLAAAGIPYADERGLLYDFHALRHEFITGLVTAGVSPKAAQDLARHSDIRLTMNVYTHLGLHDRAAALERLPALPGAAKEPAQQAKRA